MTLADLYPSNTKLSDIPPDFHGMPVKEWHKLKMADQAEKALAKLTAEGPQTDAARVDWKKQKGQEWRGKHLWTPRDDYGSKSL